MATSIPIPPHLEEVKLALRTILKSLGEDPDREGLLETPDRVIRSWGELFAGYRQSPEEILSTTFEEVEDYDEMVLLKDIPFHSTCEHHMLGFDGKAHVAYLPSRKVVGLSKLARLVDCYARRLQIQERLTRQIVQALMDYLQPRGAAVVVEAAHGCMVCRGVKKEGASMVTSAFEGAMRDPAIRSEFLTLIR